MSKYFKDHELEPDISRDKSEEDPIYMGYKAVVDSKAYDETLVSWPLILYRYGRTICIIMLYYHVSDI